MTKTNVKARENKVTPVAEVKENNVDTALREEIDRDLGVTDAGIAGTGEQPRVEGEPLNGEPRLGSFENPLPDLTEKAKEEEATETSVYLDIPLPTNRRRYSKRRETYKDWPVGKARLFENYKTNPVNAVLYPLTGDGWKFQSQKQEKGTEEGTFNYIVWRKA